MFKEKWREVSVNVNLLYKNFKENKSEEKLNENKIID